MEFKGTKGKWSIFKQDEDIHIENESSSEAIATLVGWNNEKEGEANAKLIASAPEMLDLLARILKGKFNVTEIETLIKKATL